MATGMGQVPSGVDRLPPAAERPVAERPARRDLYDTAIVAGAVVAGALSTGWPESAVQWTLLATAAVLGGLAPHSPLSGGLRVGAHRLLRRVRSVGLRRFVVWVVVVATAAGLGRTLVSSGADAAAWATARVFGCPNPTELRLLASPEGVQSARELADAFERRAAADNHGCAAVNVYVYDQPPAAAHAALASGWSTNHLRSLGPRPDLWLPGSSRYDLSDPVGTSNGLLPAAHSTPMASTPIVLAVPADAVPQQLELRRTAVTWTEALSIADDAGWGVVRPDPALSVSAELATVAMYASGGDPRRLAGPVAAVAMATTGQAREIESRIARGLDQALDRRGYPLSDGVALLCRHRELGSPRGGLIVTEQQLARFNAGRPLGGPCASAGAPEPPGKGLFAVYPVDTLSLDYPLVRLDWPQRSGQQRDWVHRFERWLGTGSGRQALNDVGLRPPARAVGEPLTEGRGVLPGVSYPRVRPSEEVLARVRTLQAAAQRPGRVLLLLDASGSMREPTGLPGRDRFAVAAAGVSLSLSLMTGRDEFGLWVFQGLGRPPRRLVPVGAGNALVGGVTRREAATRALAKVRPGGNTPLYRAIADGAAALGPADPDRVNALVVLTDGEDYGSGLSQADLLRAVRDAGVRVFVVAIGEASCGARGIHEITRSSAGACVRAGIANLDVRLNDLFRVLWGGS